LRGVQRRVAEHRRCEQYSQLKGQGTERVLQGSSRRNGSTVGAPQWHPHQPVVVAVRTPRLVQEHGHVVPLVLVGSESGSETVVHTVTPGPAGPQAADSCRPGRAWGQLPVWPLAPPAAGPRPPSVHGRDCSMHGPRQAGCVTTPARGRHGTPTRSRPKSRGH
jgi:hypothetical protein